MAHFAQLDENNVVLQVIVVNNDDMLDENGVEQEHLGVAVCQRVFGGGTWKQTSYNKNFRNKYAGVGDLYHSELNVFTRPQPYPSWTLDTENLFWIPPVSKPTDPFDDNENYMWHWDEPSLSWVWGEA